MRKIVFSSVWLCCGLLETISTFLIIPDELLSVAPPIYSQYPTIHTGTDSRLGWGFRLGRYADLQVLVELGPQTYTQPINKHRKETGTSSLKRSTTNRLSNNENNARKYRQIHNQKHEEFNNKERSTSSSNQTAAEWLRKWSEEVKRRTKQNQSDSKISNVSNKTEEKWFSNGPERKML